MKIRKEFIVGIFAALGITALILGFFFMKGQTLFGKKVEYFVVYASADGLAVGNAVKLNGVPVGKITKIQLNPNDINSTVAKFEITHEGLKIPIGTKAEMKGDVFGSVTINLKYPEILSSKNHEVGDTLTSAVADNIQATIEQKIDPLMAKVNELIVTADNAIGTINTIFSDNTSSVNSTFNKLNNSMTSFQNITRNVDSLTLALSNSRYKMTAMISNIESITNNIKASNDDITNMLANFSALSDTLAALDINGIVTKANGALDNVNLILDEIQNGDGTLTKLMQDSLLYTNLNEMVVEATRLVENIKEHPNRYIQFSVFGGKDKGAKLDHGDEKRLREFAKDSLRNWYP